MSIDRREFLEMVSVLAGSSALSSSMPWFSVFNDPLASGKGANDRVRIGIIGVGSRGSALLSNLQKLTERMNMEIAAVCDNYEPHYERAIKMTNGTAEAFTDHREMLDKVDLDGVVIATPLHEHAHITIDAFRAGLHVYCEKSMARNLVDVKEMYESHLEHDKVFLIGHQRLFSPVYLDAMIRLKEKNEIGPIVFLKAHWTRNREWIFYNNTGGRGTPLDRKLNWRLYEESSAGLFTELGSHHFQIANWVMDSQPKSVIGAGSLNFWRDGREIYDNFSAVFKYPEDIIFSYDCTSSNKHNGVEFQVLGNKGTMELETNRIYEESPPSPPAIRTLIHNIESSLFETIPIGGATWVPSKPVKEGGEFISPDYELNETLLFLEGFVQFIRKGRAPEKLTIEGYQASIWTLLSEQASKTGKETFLPEEYRI
ncbi:MAG: Gfo/Idh/MocA family oxidoreductase [Balneolaceae bacterium]